MGRLSCRPIVAAAVVGATSLFAPALVRADVPSCAPPSVKILAPADGATFGGDPAEIPVKVEVGPGDHRIHGVTIVVDRGRNVTKRISQAGQYELTVEVGMGTHALQARVSDDCGGSSSKRITVTATGGTQKGRAGCDGGCSVSRVPNRGVLGVSALLLAVFGAWRLRRASA